MFKHVIVPTDGTELSRNAARVAAGVAKALGAKLTVLHVIPPYSLPVSDGMYMYEQAFSPQEYRKSTEDYARKVLEDAAFEARKSDVSCETAFVTAPAPWDGIVKEAGKRGADLVVMASHGRRGIAAVVLGSETQKVLTHSKVPVMVTR